MDDSLEPAQTTPAEEPATASHPPLSAVAQPAGYSGRSVTVLVLALTGAALPLIGLIPSIVAVVKARGARREIRDSAGTYQGNNLISAGVWIAWSTIALTILITWATVVGTQWLSSSTTVQQLLNLASTLGTTTSTNGSLSSLSNELSNLRVLQNGHSITGLPGITGLPDGNATASSSNTTGISTQSITQQVQDLIHALTAATAHASK